MFLIPNSLNSNFPVVNVKRKKGESFESLYRRFSRRVQQSGSMLQARKTRFHQDEPNKTKVKKSALRRLVSRARREYLIRIGQLDETARTQNGPRR
ncbi:30S ribosomal protein S21 [Patescibacteria group bacterium]|nr:MAG: 30S ribosomal protein S21 [Patescibacteria group bacterium]